MLRVELKKPSLTLVTNDMEDVETARKYRKNALKGAGVYMHLDSA